MSLVEREVTTARVAASQANGKKSKCPKTPEGKARSSLNSIKTGAYVKTDNALRQIMLRRGEDPAFYDQLHLEVTEAWQPDDVMQAMAVKAIAEKSFDKAQLRAAWMESQSKWWSPPPARETSSDASATEPVDKATQGAASASGPTASPGSSPTSGQNPEMVPEGLSTGDETLT